MSTIRDYYYTGQTGGNSIYGAVWLAQTFTASSSYTITSVILRLYRLGSPGTLTVGIRATDVNGKPTGGDLCSGVTNGNSVAIFGTSGTTTTDREITLGTGVALTSGVKYAIVVRALTGDASNYVGWRLNATSPTYTGGSDVGSSNSGSTWTVDATKDLMFQTYGNDPYAPPSSDSYTSKQLVAVANGEVWYESVSGTMTQLAASVNTLITADFLSMFELYGKAFIVNKAIKKVVDFINKKLVTTDIGANPPDPGTVLTGGTSGAVMVVDYINALTGACTIYGKRTTIETFIAGETITGTDDGGNAISFVSTNAEVDGPHYYDWTVFGNSATFGVLPTSVMLGCNYKGRAVVSGDPRASHQWYMSRADNSFDFLYGANDAQSAVAGGNTDAGEVGDVVRALIPYKDDYLIFGCESSMWYLIGDPCDGGSLNELDLTTGIYGAQAWCFDNDGNFYFFGTNGLYKCKIPGTPVCVSQMRLPNLVNDETVDPATHRVVLAYDNKRIGIIIAITKLSDGSNSNYFYDLRAVDDSGICGFFPDTYPEECGIYSAFYYESKDQDYRKLLLGCKDGYIRFFDPTAKDDDIGATDEAIDSYVNFGPIQMNQDPRIPGMLTGLDCVLAGGETSGSQTDSNNVAYKVFTGDSAEAVIESLYANGSPDIAGTFRPPGRQKQTGVRKKVSGNYMGIRVGNNTAAETWAFEQLLYDVNQSGKTV